MERVERYRCPYCGKLAVHAATIERHEVECMKNPDSKNCYLCEHAREGGWVEDSFGDSEFRANTPCCAKHEQDLDSLRKDGITAKNCELYQQAETPYYTRKEVGPFD